MKKTGFKTTSRCSSKWTCRIYRLSKTGETKHKISTQFRVTSNKKWNWWTYRNKLRIVITTSPRMKRTLQELNKTSLWPLSIILLWMSKMQTSISSSSQQIPMKKEIATSAHLQLQTSKLNITRRRLRFNMFSRHFKLSDQWFLKMRFLSSKWRLRM